MVEYTFISKFDFEQQTEVSDWIAFVLDVEGKELGEINFIFCDDDYLHDINVNKLNHNTLTDIISFDHTLGAVVSGDIFISVERVSENAASMDLSFTEELHRVMVHGVLHFCGYKDKEAQDIAMMRSKEDYYLSLRTF